MMILRLGLLSAAIYAFIVLLIQATIYLTVNVRGSFSLVMAKPLWFVAFGILWAISFLIAYPLAFRIFLRP
jgi:zinc transporter ZupT